MSDSGPLQWLVPWLTKNQARIERAIGLQITRPLDNPYGCGTYGCVYPLSDPRYVLKISNDENEGPINKAVIDLRKAKGKSNGYGPSTILPGVVFYRNLFADDTSGSRIYIIVREEVQPFTWSDVQKLNWYPHPQKPRVLTDPLNISTEVIDDFFESDDLSKIQSSFNEWLKWVYLIGLDLPLVADAMTTLCNDAEIVLRDVHWGNVGRTTVDWGKKYRPPGSVVIHDLGLSITEPKRIPKLNPVVADAQREQVVSNLMTRALRDLLREHNVKTVPDNVRFSDRQLEGWPDVRFNVQGATEHSKPWICAAWISTEETWTSELLHGNHLREPQRVR